MLETLRLVFGAVATKDIQPLLTHVLVYENRMQGGDGVITIDAPFACKLPAMAIPGQKFLNAVIACGGDPDLKLMESGRLQIKKNGFKASLTLLPADDFPKDERKGEAFPVNKELLKVLQQLKPFVSKDASRPWSMGIKLSSDGFAFATNNVVLAAIPFDAGIGTLWPEPTIPSVAIEALLAMKEVPTSMHVEDTSLAFEYNDGTWLKTRLTTAPWPDIGAVLSRADHTKCEAIPEELCEAVIKVKQYCTNTKFPTVTLSEAGVSSDDGGGDIAEVEGFTLTKGLFNADMLVIVLSNATHVDLTGYPEPCAFKGENGLYGVFVGVRP